MNRTLKEISRLQANFDHKHEGNIPFFEEISGDNVAGLEHLLVCLMGEVGELANVIKKIRRGDKVYSQQHDAIIEEIVDIFIYVIKLANQIGFDLEDMYDKKMKANSERFRDFEK
jgi:NTP pyrophosphatase (non-canonical NTP hydrolase)